MKLLQTLILVIAVTLSSSALAESYTTEATLTVNKSKTQYLVDARIGKLVERDGKTIEEVVSRPRVVSAPGVPASFYVGPDRGSANYANEENISMEVSWPKKEKAAPATCTIAIKRGDIVLSKTILKLRLKVK